MSWALGLGSSPGEEAVEGNGEIVSFHHGEPEGPLPNKVFRWSSRPRGRGHPPALVTEKGLFISFICWIPRPVNFSSSFLFFYLSPGLGEVPAFSPIKWVLPPNLIIFYYCHEYQGSWRFCANSREGRKENSRDISALHGFPCHLICIQTANSTQIYRPDSHRRPLAYISGSNSCRSPQCSPCSRNNGLLSGPGHTESTLPHAVSLSSTWLHEPYIFLCKLSFLTVLSQLLMAMGKAVTSHDGNGNKRYWVMKKKEGEL